LGKHFQDRNDFKSFFDSIPTDDKRNEFLRIASFYRFLVVTGKFYNEDPSFNRSIEYLDNTYKYIAIFALIEAIYEKDEYVDFYAWLNKRRLSPGIFPIGSKEHLDRLHRQYKKEHGSVQKAIKFFESLDDEDRKLIREKLRVPAKDKSIEELSKFLYSIRSDFVHRARLILMFGEGSFATRKKNETIFSELDLQDLCLLFEHGLLKHYGYRLRTE
jgi:hypothetical protein